MMQGTYRELNTLKANHKLITMYLKLQMVTFDRNLCVMITVSCSILHRGWKFCESTSENDSRQLQC